MIFPRNREDLIHRSGRTGRAGGDGLAISLVTHKDWNLMIRLQREAGLRFEQKKLPGLEAKFKGPHKTKASGKNGGHQETNE